jgi:hypothetical protein
MPAKTRFLTTSAPIPLTPATTTREARMRRCASTPHRRICRSYVSASRSVSAGAEDDEDEEEEEDELSEEDDISHPKASGSGGRQDWLAPHC